jgi:hypothetical protein
MSKKEIIETYGREAYETARMFIDLADPDGAWSLATENGMFDVAEVIEEIMEEED